MVVIMYYSLNGTLIYKDAFSAVIECGGVGYKCLCSFNTLKKLGPTGGSSFLFTYLSVREDSMELFGFFGQDELDCFKLLTSVSGVGAKTALAALSDLDANSFALCVASGDYKRLRKVPGIGEKTAQRIVVDLKDKVAGVSVSNIQTVENILYGKNSNVDEAVEALTSLGYSRSDASSAVSGISSAAGESDQPDTGELIKQALKKLSGK